MKGISVDYSNILVKFLTNNSKSKYFRVVQIWPDPVYPQDLPKDTCSFFWCLVGHSLITLKNFIWAFVFAFCVGFLSYSIVTAIILWVYFGLNPVTMHDVVASIGANVLIASVLFSSLLGSIFLYHHVQNKIKVAARERDLKRGSSKPSMIYEGARLAGTLIMAIKDKTCFKIEYIKGDSDGRN